MNRPALRWWLLGAVAYLVFLALTFPAQYLADNLAKKLPALQLTAVSGNLFAGTAAEVRYQGASLGAVDWHFDWLAPFSLTLGYRIHLHAEDRDLLGRVDFGFNRVELKDLEGRIPVAAFDSLLPLPPGSLEGALSPHLRRLTLKAGHLASAEGELDLDEATLKWPTATTLGSFRMSLTPAADGIQAQVSDVASPFRLNAALSLTQAGAYHLSGTLAARDPGDTATRNLLAGLGRPDSTGQYPFDFKGQW
ncbi:MAG TPA: type II secretion system protein N [Gammaproteobacteria bacterium]